MISRDDMAALDRADPLAAARGRFDLPDGVIYLDGNSLGPLPRNVPARLAEVGGGEWRGDLIKSWNVHGWMDLPLKGGDRIAPLIGAGAGEVLAADSTSVNLFKLMAAALELRPGRKVIVSQAGNFPTDNYIAEGLIRFAGKGHELRLVDGNDVLAVYSATQQAADRARSGEGPTLVEAIPLGRFGGLTEIARTVAFLLSEDAGYITGQMILADGGLNRGI